MALNECAGCTTLFAVGMRACPHCRSTDFVEQGQDMPKITEHGGPSNAAEPGPELTASTGAVIATSGAWTDEIASPADVMSEAGDMTGEGLAAGLPEPVETETVEEEPSPGNNSETSSETPSSEPEPSEKPTPSPARKTASRSKKAPTESPSARGTDGAPADGTSAADKEE